MSPSRTSSLNGDDAANECFFRRALGEGARQSTLAMKPRCMEIEMRKHAIESKTATGKTPTYGLSIHGDCAWLLRKAMDLNRKPGSACTCDYDLPRKI